MCEGYMIGDKHVGDWIFYYEDGTVFSKGQNTDEGIPTGIWSEYYPNGQIRYEAESNQGNCFDLKDEGLRILNYWNEDGIQLIADGFGELVLFHDNGLIAHTSHWRHCVKNGTLQEFYDDGQLKHSANYSGGFRDGVSTGWFPNGQVRIQTHYCGGKPVGTATEWYENSQCAEEGYYENDKYLVQNFWDEQGNHLLVNGKGHQEVRLFGI